MISKPLFYHPTFIEKHLAGQPDDGQGVGPKDFARALFPELVADRKPRYQTLADNFGFTIDAADLYHGPDGGTLVPEADEFLGRVFDVMSAAAAGNDVASANARSYVQACLTRATDRGMDL